MDATLQQILAMLFERDQTVAQLQAAAQQVATERDEALKKLGEAEKRLAAFDKDHTVPARIGESEAHKSGAENHDREPAAHAHGANGHHQPSEQPSSATS